MLTDYKYIAIREEDDGTVTATMRTYEGEITTEDEYRPVGGTETNAPTSELTPVTRYRRTAALEEKTITVASMAQLESSANEELAKDATRTPIDEQTNA
jgi:hypothetical protein